MTDTFASFTPSLESPASQAFEVTPSDTADLPNFSRALTANADGLVQLTTTGGDTVSITLLAGVPFPVRCRRVWNTGTTATGIVALY